MTWFWQQQINYSNIGSNSVQRDTGWISPNNSTERSQSDGLVATQTYIIEPYPSQSSRLSTVYYNSTISKWYGGWVDLSDVIDTSLLSYSFAMTPNGMDTNKTIDLSTVSFNDFNFSIPANSTIKGIELKVVRQAYGLHNMTWHDEDDTASLVFDGKSFNIVPGTWTNDQYYFDDDITH